MADGGNKETLPAKLGVSDEQARYLATMLRRAVSAEVTDHGKDEEGSDRGSITSFTRLMCESAALALEGKDFLQVMEQAGRTWTGDEEQEKSQAIEMRGRADRELAELVREQESRMGRSMQDQARGDEAVRVASSEEIEWWFLRQRDSGEYN